MKTVKHTLERLKFIFAFFYYVAVRHPLVIRLFHIKHKRSYNRIEIDLTYDCQLKCINCNRSCRQAPSEERMTKDQIKKFIKESKENSVKWERIRVIGGEPTLHPDLIEILNLLLEYKRDFSFGTEIQLVTNGFGEKFTVILQKIPEGIRIENSSKKSSLQLFSPFNLAPVDKKNYKAGDYSYGCINLSCGLSLSAYGYYCCGIAAGIDRVFGFNIGRSKLPDSNDPMNDHLKTFCELCGIFASFRLVKDELISLVWQKAYNRYREKKPQLNSY